MTPALHLGRLSVAGHPQDGRPLDHGEGIEQGRPALALLVASEEEHGGQGGSWSSRVGTADSNRSMSTPL